MSDRRQSPTRGFESILCAVDFSPQSSVALEVAADLTSRGAGHLTALYAEIFSLLDVSAVAMGYSTVLMRKSTVTQLQQLAQRVARRAGLARDAWSVDTVVGTPAAAIVTYARKKDSDLIVMGTNGRRGAARLFFGTVADGVLRRTPSPVRAVPKSARRQAHRARPARGIVGAIELGRNERSDALRIARVAKMLGQPLTLLHAVAKTEVHPFLAPQLEQEDCRRLADAHSRLSRLAQSVGAASRVVLGRPDEEIPAAALERRAALVVLALRRGRGLFGSRQGTTTYRVLCGSTVPVLALPPVRPRRDRKAS